MEQPKRVTVKDIAKTVNLPAATVKYALNDLPGLKKSVKLQVLKAAKRLGYINKQTVELSYRVSIIQPQETLHQKEVVMADIAHVLQVSVSTVSRALNGSSPIGAQTKQRVAKAAKDLGYVINTDARALRVSGGSIAGNKSNVTMGDIASYLALSVATVSRCFATNGDVSPATKKMVLDIAQDMGYTVAQHARRLRVKTAK